MGRNRDRLVIEKLLRLAQSPNPHEAERARDEAERLMRKNGWSYADFQKDATVDVPVSPDLVDVNLARIVGISRRAQTAINRRDQLAYVGKRECAERARDLYLHLVNSAETGWKRGCGPNEPGAKVYRRYFWGGFIHSITDRLKQAEVEVWTPPPPVVEEGSAFRVVESGKGELSKRDDAKEDLQNFAERLQDSHSLKLFCEHAYQAGIAFGRHLVIPEDDSATKDTRRMLDDSSEAEDIDIAVTKENVS